jgi:hypothetical protein
MRFWLTFCFIAPLLYIHFFKIFFRLLYVNQKIIGTIFEIEDYIKSELGLDGGVSAYTVSLSQMFSFVPRLHRQVSSYPTQKGVSEWVKPLR